MEQAPVTFDDVAVYFTEEEWECLHSEQRSLYKEVMSDNYQMILSLNRPDIITNIELGYEPYITSTAPRSIRAEFLHTELSQASDTAVLQENSHETRGETGLASAAPLKRQRRYPRVNPLRWLKKYKKSKSRSHRIAKRSERSQDNPVTNNGPRTHLGDADYGACTDTAEESSETSLDGSLEGLETSKETDDQNSPQAEQCPGMNHNDQCTQTGCTESEDKPEFQRSLNMAASNLPVPAVTKAQIAAKPEKLNSNHRTANNQRCNNATDPSPLSPKATGVLKEVQSPGGPESRVVLNQGKGGRNSAASQRKEKHVQFSDKVTTFVFEPQAQERFAEGIADGIKLRSRSPPRPTNINVSPKVVPSLGLKPVHTSPRDEENKALKDQGFRPDTVQQEGKKAMTANKSEEGSRDPKLPNGVKCHKKVKAKADMSQEREPSSQKPLSQAPACSDLKKDAGTQIDLFSMEEEPKPTMPPALLPSSASPTDLALVKSYSCSNCGKTTHWTRLSDQQKANVENCSPYICKMCSRQREKLKAAESPGRVTGNSPLAKCAKLAKAAASPDKVIGTQNSTPRCVKLVKAAESPGNIAGTNNSPLTKLPKSGKATATPDKADGKQNSPLTRCTKPGMAMLPGSPCRKKPYCKLPTENTDSSPAAKKPKPDKDVNWEELSRRLKSSPNHDAQKREKNANQSKTASEPQSLHTEKRSILCRKCAHSCSSEDPKPQQKLNTMNDTPTKSSSTNRVSSPNPKPHPKLKTLNGTPTNQIPSPDPKKSIPEKRKAIKDLQNGTSHGAEKHTSPGARAPSSGGEGVDSERLEMCSNCGKCFVKRKPKPLTSVQHTSPTKAGSTGSPDKTRKSEKPDLASNRTSKPSPKEKKAKKPESRVPKSPKVAKSELCTKCGKRLVLHVVPNQDGSGEGGNENECVVLPRKKRKRPLAGMEPFKCNECGKIFTRHFSLMQHRFIHTGERPYTCKVCRKSFRDAGYLTVHMRSHTNEKPYSCSECGKSFSQHSALVVHQRTHTDERPFQCKDCGKSFTDRSTFRNHQRIHTGEKPYACSFCGKKFTQQPHMKRHESIHTGDRPFRCRQCGKRFIDRCKLKKHELIHTRWED